VVDIGSSTVRFAPKAEAAMEAAFNRCTAKQPAVVRPVVPCASRLSVLAFASSTDTKEENFQQTECE
jgi:hypothetical protein